MIRNFEELIKKAKEQPKMKLAVAVAQDKEVLMAISRAYDLGIVESVLVGDMEKIKKIAGKHEIKIENIQIIDIKESHDAARKAVEIVSIGKADFLMKGLVDTSILLKAVLDKEMGLRTDGLLSHVMVYQLEKYHKQIILTDGGMNIAPSLEEKIVIIKNAVKVAKAMGIHKVKVAVLAAKEKVHPKMQATIDGNELKKIGQGGEFGESVIIEGPLAFDLAISKQAAKTKGVVSDVAGDADILLVPTIEVGNGIGKALTYFANADSAGVIMGAKVPIVLVSRADTYEAKLYSIALGSVIAANK